ncbi:SDR family oxidoreductase [Limibaculum sp. M0105]|uniref:SDR family oxidoreductase n=1 Tax=Thermohalobaculum xanthum TaxID=2753746 RepID=A0A8J7M8D7_9RHOB|nr:SDR family oxidoreductase [Thermohalobaculum xanthum]MBK0400191.1 SDR family oxidoreductase [Thermohalobaculum xanthum]
MAPGIDGIAGQSVLIIGGSSGIGLAAARTFDAAGARVTIVGRSAERGAAARAELGAGATFRACDAAEPASLERMVADTLAAHGRIDTLMVSPGTTRLPELLFRQSLEDIRTSLIKDLAPVLLSCRAVLPAMMAQGAGCIINVASDAGKIATPGESVIGANMAAVIQFTRGLAIEGKRNGIRANVITPSLVEGTPLTERLMAEGTFPAKLFAKARQLAHLGPTTPEDLASLALFLAGPGAARITGQAISVNGGISAA